MNQVARLSASQAKWAAIGVQEAAAAGIDPDYLPTPKRCAVTVICRKALGIESSARAVVPRRGPRSPGFLIMDVSDGEAPVRAAISVRMHGYILPTAA